MKARYTVIAAAIAGFGLGAVTIDQLHAQAKPPVFYIGEIDVKNAEAYGKEYAPKAQATIRKAGGKILAAGSNITVIEAHRRRSASRVPLPWQACRSPNPLPETERPPRGLS